MPTYEYICLSCDKNFERYQRITENSLESCPHCSGAVKRLISGGQGFIMKGGNTSLGSDSSCSRSGSCSGGSCGTCSK